MHLLHFNDVLIRPLKDEGKTKEERQKKLQRILSLSSTLLLLMGVLSLSMGLSIRILSMRLREGDVTQIQKSLSVANPPFSPTGLSSPDDNATSSLRSVNDIQLTSAASASAKHKKGNSVASTLKSKSLLHKQKPQPKSAAAQHLTNALKNVRWSLKCSALGGFIACLVSMLEILVAVLALIVIFSGRRSVLIAHICLFSMAFVLQTGLMGFLLFNSDALLKGSENFIASCLEQTSLCTDSIRDKIDKQVNHIARLNGGLAGINLAALTIEAIFLAWNCYMFSKGNSTVSNLGRKPSAISLQSLSGMGRSYGSSLSAVSEEAGIPRSKSCSQMDIHPKVHFLKKPSSRSTDWRRKNFQRQLGIPDERRRVMNQPIQEEPDFLPPLLPQSEVLT